MASGSARDYLPVFRLTATPLERAVTLGDATARLTSSALVVSGLTPAAQSIATLPATALLATHVARFDRAGAWAALQPLPAGPPPLIGVPRTAVTAPVSPVMPIDDGHLFESPQNPMVVSYLPRYQVAEAQANGRTIFLIELDPIARRMSVLLEAIRPAELDTRYGDAARAATVLLHTIDVRLRYKLLRTDPNSPIEELAFTEHTAVDGKLRVAFQTETALKLQQIADAISQPEFAAQLVVVRTVQVAAPTQVVPDPPIVSSGTATLQPGARFDVDTGATSGSGILLERSVRQIKRRIPILRKPFPPGALPQFRANLMPRIPIGGGDGDVPTRPLPHPLPPDDPPEQTITIVTRRLLPDAGIGICNLGMANYDAISCAQLQQLSYAPDPIDVSPSNSQAARGVVLAIRTTAGNYAKLRIESAGDDFTISWATYAPPPYPPGTQLYQESTLVSEQRIEPQPFAFSPTFNPEIFARMTGPSGPNQALIRHDVQWNGLAYSYYQDAFDPQTYKYLPDAFRLARRNTAPRGPDVLLTFLDSARVQVDYTAVPCVSADRISAAAAALGMADGQTFQPLLLPGSMPDQQQAPVRVMLDFPPGVTAEHTTNMVDLRQGIDGELTMAIEHFQQLFAALCGTAGTFGGWVEIDVAGQTERVPFQARLDDLVGDLVTVTKAADGQGVVMRNTIESPLRIAMLSAAVVSGEQPVAVTIKDAAGNDIAYPVALAAGAELRLSLQRADATPVSDGVLFDLRQVSVQLDQQAALRAMYNQSVPPERTRHLAVTSRAEQYAGGKSATVVFVRGDHQLDLTATQLTGTVDVQLPLEQFLLGAADDGSYEYTLIVKIGDEPLLAEVRRDHLDPLPLEF